MEQFCPLMSDKYDKMFNHHRICTNAFTVSVCEAPNKQLHGKLLKIDQTEYNQDSKGALTPAHSDAEEPRGWWCCSQLSKKLPPQKPHRELPYWISALVSPDVPATLRVSLIWSCQQGRDVLFCHTEIRILMIDACVISTKKKQSHHLTSEKGKRLNKFWFLLQML